MDLEILRSVATAGVSTIILSRFGLLTVAGEGLLSPFIAILAIELGLEAIDIKLRS